MGFPDSGSLPQVIGRIHKNVTILKTELEMRCPGDVPTFGVEITMLTLQRMQYQFTCSGSIAANTNALCEQTHTLLKIPLKRQH